MRFGDILGFATRQARNHEGRYKYKYHLYLCVTPDRSGEHLFLLISSSGADYDMRIDQHDWPEMSKSESHVNCQQLYQHSDTGLTRAKTKGRLSDDALRRLLDHVEVSETFTEDDIGIIIDAARRYFNP